MFEIVACLFALVTVGNACMCMPSHPQQDICRENSFVALVKIRSSAYVSVYETKPEQNNKAAAGLTIVDKQMETDAKDENPETRITPTAPSNEIVVDGDIEKERQEASYIRYRIKIYKAYKGIDTALASSHKFYIYTSPDEGMCGRTFTLKGTYLIIGTIRDGRLTVNLCDHVIQWKSLPKVQKRNIRENMMSIKSVCDAGCEVTSCLWSDCEAESRKECTWNSKMERLYGAKYDRSNFLCVPSAKRGCVWSGVAIAKLEKKARRRRRRRRHSRLNHRRRHLAPPVLKPQNNFMP